VKPILDSLKIGEEVEDRRPGRLHPREEMGTRQYGEVQKETQALRTKTAQADKPLGRREQKRERLLEVFLERKQQRNRLVQEERSLHKGAHTREGESWAEKKFGSPPMPEEGGRPET